MPFNPWRKKVKTLFAVGCLAVLALAAGSVAKANDLNLKGPYIGVAIGDFVARSDAQTTTVFSSTGYFGMTSVTAIGDSGAQRTKPSGFIGSGLVGYNFLQNGNVVVGAEVDFGVLHANDVKTVTTTYPCCAGTAFTITQQVSANWLGTARPRVGYLVGSVLIYGTGGLAAIHTDMHELFTDTFAAAQQSGVVVQNAIGWTVGGGIEYAAVNHWSVRAEYLHAAFSRGTATSTNLTATSAPGTFPVNVFTNSADFHTGMLRVVFTRRF